MAGGPVGRVPDPARGAERVPEVAVKIRAYLEIFETIPDDVVVETFSNVAGWSSRSTVRGTVFEWGESRIVDRNKPDPWFYLNSRGVTREAFQAALTEACRR